MLLLSRSRLDAGQQGWPKWQLGAVALAVAVGVIVRTPGDVLTVARPMANDAASSTATARATRARRRLRVHDCAVLKETGTVVALISCSSRLGRPLGVLRRECA